MTTTNTITFFTGTTFDGHPWVLSFEGGPTATDPAARCRVSGRIGPKLKVRHLNALNGSELRAVLPSLNLEEVEREITSIVIAARFAASA